MMFSHVVLMKPRADLTERERTAFVRAFDRALREIPSVRAVRIGERVTHGAGYEPRMPDTGHFIAIIDFDDLAGLQAYLRHPAHEQLGALFYETISSGLVYDYEIGGIERLANY